MTLAASVPDPTRPTRVLLRSGYELGQATVDRLADMRVPYVWIRFPGLSFMAERVSPAVESRRATLAQEIAGMLDASGADEPHAKLDYRGLADAVSSLVEAMGDYNPSRDLLSELACDRAPMRHATNVALLSLQIGLRVGDYLVHTRQRVGGRRARDLTPLGLGAMLHDFGMLNASDDARERWLATGAEDSGRHTIDGYRAVQGKMPPAATIAVLDHHQHCDGSGFPRRKDGSEGPRAPEGDEIHVYARIVAVADAFDTRCHPPGEDAEGTACRVAALRSIYEQSKSGLFDPTIVLGLLVTCPPFPPGSIVRLSDGRRAGVVSWDALDPCRPLVREIDLDGYANEDAPPGEEIDLRASPRLRIVESDGRDVSEHLYFPGTPAEFDLDKKLNALFRSDAA